MTEGNTWRIRHNFTKQSNINVNCIKQFSKKYLKSCNTSKLYFTNKANNVTKYHSKQSHKGNTREVTPIPTSMKMNFSISVEKQSERDNNEPNQ